MNARAFHANAFACEDEDVRSEKRLRRRVTAGKRSEERGEKLEHFARRRQLCGANLCWQR
eukprot:1979386-Rhodomonas_salina.2